MAISPFSARVASPVAALGIEAVFVTMHGLCNRGADEQFAAITAARQEAIRASLAIDQIERDPVLAGFRQLHTTVGVSNRKNVASPETLLRLLLKRGRLPHINLLVDLYNLVSIETRLSLGAHDLRNVRGNVELRLTDGSESFHPLGQPEPEPVRPGEYAYVDDANDVLCRLEVRQAQKSKITTETTDCFLILQGNPATDATLLRDATGRLLDGITQFCGGEHEIIHAPWK